jgi:hypothetical protein
VGGAGQAGAGGAASGEGAARGSNEVVLGWVAVMGGGEVGWVNCGGKTEDEAAGGVGSGLIGGVQVGVLAAGLEGSTFSGVDSGAGVGDQGGVEATGLTPVPTSEGVGTGSGAGAAGAGTGGGGVQVVVGGAVGIVLIGASGAGAGGGVQLVAGALPWSCGIAGQLGLGSAAGAGCGLVNGLAGAGGSG